MLQKRGIGMKTKGTFFSLSTLALTAVLLLSGCGSEKKKETSPSSTSKIAQVKQSSTSKKERKRPQAKPHKAQKLHNHLPSLRAKHKRAKKIHQLQ